MEEKLVHGGDIYSPALVRADFSANLNPLGMPERVRLAAQEAVLHSQAYPDPLCRKLRKALSESEQLPADWILCGNGAADLIFRLAFGLKPKKALLCAPSFADYQAALEAAGSEIVWFDLEEREEFQVTPRILDAITPETELMMLCNPNNPTGQTIEPPLMRRILNRCAETGTFLMVDECFLDFLEEQSALTVKPMLSDFPNLLILKAFTKLYAMAGLRLGWCECSNEAVIRAMQKSGQSWGVSVPAQAAGVAALDERQYPEQTRRFLKTERAFLREGLERLGMQVLGSKANYLFFRAGTQELCPRLRKQGILLRNCGNYRGLDGFWYRAAVRTREENELLLTALSQIKQQAEG